MTGANLLLMHYAMGIGANLGDREATFSKARAFLVAHSQVAIVATSTPIVSAPMGGPRGQEWFLNAVWIVASELGPHGVLLVLQRIETACGRSRTVPWGPRLIDLDLLARADGLRVQTPVLTLPHPRMAERPFVTTPLSELRARGQWM